MRDALLMMLGVFVLAFGFKLLTASNINVASLWLANGFAVGMLLTSPRARWPLLLAMAFVGGTGSAYLLRADPALIPWIAVLNVCEILVATLLLAQWVRSAADLTSRRNFVRFLLCGVIAAPTAMALLLGCFNFVRGAPFSVELAQRLMVGHGLGMAIMVPVALALRSGEVSRYFRSDSLLETALTLVSLLSVTGLVFYQNGLPLLFLIFVPMVRIALRGGFVGTAVAALLVVIVGAAATAGGHGPIAALRTSELVAQHAFLADGFVVLQTFIASLLVSLFPMVVSAADGQRALRATEELQNRLRLLMEHSSDVIILTDLDGKRLYVSPAVREMVGIEPDEFVRLSWRDYVHDGDQLLIGTQIEEAQRTRTSRTLTFRARHTSGRIIWIEAHMKYFRDRAFDLMQTEKDSGISRNCGPHGDEGFVVTMRDISARRKVELELESANAELANLIRKDSLTGLANRRRFDEVLAQSWERAQEGGWPIAVLMIDVDHFKQFNDCYGHPRGDVALREVAEAITSGLFHPDDLAARYGGEEFAVILPRTTTDNAARVAERIRNAVFELQRPHVTTEMGILTVSVGVAAAYAVRHGDPMAVVRAADEALYTSKKEGRNRTTLMDVNWPKQSAATG